MKTTQPLDLAQFEGFTPGPWTIGAGATGLFPKYPIMTKSWYVADVPIMAQIGR